MRRPHPLTGLLLPLTVVLALATGCGGDDGDDGSDPSSTAPASDTSAPPTSETTEPNQSSGPSTSEDPSDTTSGDDGCAHLADDDVSAALGTPVQGEQSQPGSCQYTGTDTTSVVALSYVTDIQATPDDLRNTAKADCDSATVSEVDLGDLAIVCQQDDTAKGYLLDGGDLAIVIATGLEERGADVVTELLGSVTPG